MFAVRVVMCDAAAWEELADKSVGRGKHSYWAVKRSRHCIITSFIVRVDPLGNKTWMVGQNMCPEEKKATKLQHRTTN